MTTAWALTDDIVLFYTPGTLTWAWPTGWEKILLEGVSAGGSGGGSATLTQGGGGGSGCWGQAVCFRPAGGTSVVLIGAGGVCVPAGSAIEGTQGGESAFNDQWFFRGGGGGQQSASVGAGGDGGFGGAVLGGPWINYLQGSQGGASSPGNWFPMGGMAPLGCAGGNNHQGGGSPGGGGAPGDLNFASGAGGNARITVRRLIPVTL